MRAAVTWIERHRGQLTEQERFVPSGQNGGVQCHGQKLRITTVIFRRVMGSWNRKNRFRPTILVTGVNCPVAIDPTATLIVIASERIACFLFQWLTEPVPQATQDELQSRWRFIVLA